MAKKMNKGLNMEKVMEIREEVEEVLVEENTPVVISEMAEHIGSSLEDVDALREMCVEEFNKEMNIVEEKEMEMDNMKNKINNGIKFAILSGKGVESDKKYVSNRQLQAILKSYKELVGCDMDSNQQMYLKKLNPQQVSNVLHTLNVARRTFNIA